MKSNATLIRLALVLAALLPARFVRASNASSAEDESDHSGSATMDVVVNLTDEGRKVAPPTPERPVYYLPFPVGYKDYGYEAYYGPKRNPPDADIQNAFFRALAQQGYQIMTHENHPSIVLYFSWGYMAPPAADTQAFQSMASAGGGMSGGIQSAPGGAQGALSNNMYPQMLDLVAGNTFGTEISPTDPRLDQVRQMVNQPRYYIYVTAFSFDSWLKNYKEVKNGDKNPADTPVLLWRAHVSCELWGHYFDQVAQALITSGAPWFGRETKRPEVSTSPLVPIGRVILGTPVVKDFKAKPATGTQP